MVRPGSAMRSSQGRGPSDSWSVAPHRSSRVLSWGGLDSNQRPADYEFDPTPLGYQGKSTESVPEQRFRLLGTAQRFATFRSPSRDTRGTHLTGTNRSGATNQMTEICVIGPMRKRIRRVAPTAGVRRLLPRTAVQGRGNLSTPAWTRLRPSDQRWCARVGGPWARVSRGLFASRISGA
jgi:hypothetical protein